MNKFIIALLCFIPSLAFLASGLFDVENKEFIVKTALCVSIYSLGFSIELLFHDAFIKYKDALLLFIKHKDALFLFVAVTKLLVFILYLIAIAFMLSDVYINHTPKTLFAVVFTLNALAVFMMTIKLKIFNFLEADHEK